MSKKKQTELDIALQPLVSLTSEQLKFIDLYHSCGLNVTKASQAMGITRQVYYRWLEQPMFKSAIDEFENILINNSIECINKAIQQGDAKSAQFILKTLHPKFKDKIDLTSNGNTMGSVIQIIYPKEEPEDE